MPRVSRGLIALAAFVLVAPTGAAAQSAGQPPAQAAGAAAQPLSLSRDEITAFAKLFVAISKARDSSDHLISQARNKTPQAQQQLQEQLRTNIDAILHHNGVSAEEYRRKTFLVSTDNAVRKIFDSTVAAVTGVPIPGQVAARPGQITNLPPGAVGTHIGHVANGFTDTPGGQGLLPTAMAEARVAAQHAALSARTPTNLASMKLHAGHVIHALDPTVETMGPGAGYGVKKAALGVASHIELAAKAQGASQGIITHSVHIATSARNTVQRVDSLIALAKQVQAATDAAAAAAIVTQMVSLSEQLIAGADANANGRVTWEAGEGGLQTAQEHITLMLAGENR